ncbi:SLAP domain-containing protein [Companilactobacillus baiquanensis]|uniref:SLAP domain-containing protein n=1 Tax=Companilactobacillus baiquanensis TaxID=2486005 RepID=A0ABW1UUW1_9LACO|nr:SLAP domain-containing protein [Companilactobacillus baiquanensis]
MKLQPISNKKVLLISLLSFTGGLALVSNANIVHADTTNDSTTSEITANSADNMASSETNADTTQINSPTVKSEDTTNSESNNVTSNNTTQNNSGSDTQNYSATTTTVQPNTESTTANTSLTVPTDTAADHQGQLSGDDGSSWYLGTDGTLHIGSGTVSDPTFDDTTETSEPVSDGVWNNYKYADDITSVSFEDGAVAGSSLANYFSGLSNLKTADVSNLDVSNTLNFSKMFFNTVSLDSLDISNWKFTDGVNLSQFVSGSGVKNLNLSGITLTNPNMYFSFGYDTNLESINLTDFSATNVTNATDLFYSDSNLTDLDLSGFHTIAINNSMLAGLTSLKSLKVNSDTVLYGSNLLNPTGYKGWTDGTNLYTASDLSAVYGDNSSTNESARTSTTWTATSSTSVNYTINYYNDSTNELIDTINGTGTQGDTIKLTPNYPGYSAVTDEGTTSVTLPTSELGQTVADQVYNFHLAPLAANVLTVTESDKNSTNTLSSQTKNLIDGDTEANLAAIAEINSNLDSGRTLDLDDTSVDFTINGVNVSGKMTDESLQGLTVSQVIFSLANNGQTNPDGTYPELPSDTTAEQLVYYLADILLSFNGSGSINLVYEPEVSTGDNSNSSGSSTSTTLKDQNINTTTNVVNLYDANGKLVTNRGLSINSSWKSDAEYYSNGVLYYRVSSDEYVKASDVYVYTDNLANIKVNADQKGDLVDYLGAELDRKLGSGSEWKTDKIALINGKKYYRVSTDEFILADEVAEY